jgi:lysophospholipase L1-like esterase
MTGLQRWTGTLLNLGLLVVGTTLGLVLAELALRAVLAPPVPETMDFFRLNNSSYYQADSLVGWRPRPNQSGRHDQKGRFTSSFTTNSVGLRDREHAVERGSARHRIVILGDSFAWGWGVNDDQLFSRHLELLLPAVEVINLGVTAYGLPQEIAWLRLVGLRYRPDIVVLALCQNDIYDVAVARPEPAGHDTAALPSTLSRAKTVLARRSYLYRMVRDRLHAAKPLSRVLVRLGLREPLGGLEALDPSLVPSLLSGGAEVEAAWVRAEQRLLQLKRITDSAEARLVIAVIPVREAAEPSLLARSIAWSRFEPRDFDLGAPERRLARFGEQHGIPVITPLTRFQQVMSQGQDLFLPADIHFNGRGHRLFAEVVADGLREARIVNDGPGATK